ncbi:hypothetical protein LV164_000617 [Aspergillus fumigatus]|nr:hypothetical protein KXX42_002726 [Aspergillus fumigatus]KAH1546616.1 hypothetical protein KXX57_003336 [Aspergillus fumigatus]KAH1984215.1 hypothetical protein KXW88_002420 [Aspergillus fumigatus]KAH2672331.1 hypothetical protein KXV32_000809 [Aspergillus fumigatus]KAH2750748.1 hypothetical protein KXV94_002801 [Aspergillus fumigatus]
MVIMSKICTKSIFPSKLAMYYETLSVNDADERVDGRIERRGECQACNNMAIPVSALEAAVEQGKTVLGELVDVFNQPHVSTAGTAWRDAISELLESARKPKVVIRVLGATGAGKSSLINDRIDERRLGIKMR